MRNTIILGMVGLLALAAPAMAQVTGPNGSTSGATSNSVTNVFPSSIPTTANGQVAADPQGYSPYNTHATVDNHGIPNQAPALSIGSVYGLNPCSVGASVGVTTPLVGVGGAISSADPACEARNNAALAITAFHNEILAREMLCERKEWREAWKAIGKPCIEDQAPGRPVAPIAAAMPMNSSPQVAATPATPAPSVTRLGVVMVPTVVNPSSLVMTTEVPAPAARPAPAHVRPDWCEHVSSVEQNPATRKACM